ncbi:MAG: hypothetical protein PVJ67_02125 [Candidatus Pacearchaeota archaeon]|jgi:hypothetical protein
MPRKINLLEQTSRNQPTLNDNSQIPFYSTSWFTLTAIGVLGIISGINIDTPLPDYINVAGYNITENVLMYLASAGFSAAGLISAIKNY